MEKETIAANAGKQKTKMTCPSFETVRQEIKRIMRDQHLTFRGAIAFAKRDHRFRDLAERLGFGVSEKGVA
ncbi:MAG: hypothetical protein II840_13035 [Kiritimatiellae bacterium]|nr:hypothetical protein [Kiritimatiellia bacterium]